MFEQAAWLTLSPEAARAPFEKESTMSELGVLDLSEYGAFGQAATPVPGTALDQRQKKRMARFFKRFPQLIPAAAAISFEKGRFARNHPLIMAKRALRNRQQTAYNSKLIAKQTGISPDVTDTKGPAAIQTAYSPQSYAARRGWWPRAVAGAQAQSPWKGAKPMGVRATIKQGR